MESRTVLFLLYFISSFHNIDLGEGDTSDEGVKRRNKRYRNTWTSEMDAQIAELYRNSNFNGSERFEEVKCEWYKLHPDSRVSARALYSRYLQMSHLIEGSGKRPKRFFKWDKEKYADLVDAYLHTRPYDQYSIVELRDEWKRRHKDSPEYANHYLSMRARECIEKRKLNVQGESSRKLFEWTHRRDSDLLHIYNVTLPEGKGRAISMHRILADLHPDLTDITSDQMMERIDYLQRNPPDEHFPWTMDQNKELLKIYHSTLPEMADQGQRIYDIWTKIHPRYKFMTPYYLQVHTSTLAHHEKTKGGRRKRIHFTDEQKAFVIDTYRRFTSPKKPLYDFHREWVREYPSFAHFPSNKLACNARKWMKKEDSSSENMAEAGGESENRKHRSQVRHSYTPEARAKLLTIYHQTDPNLRGHSARIRMKWTEEEDALDVDDKSLRKMIRRWMREDSKKKGKEPLLTPKTEVESESSPSASDMSL